MRDLKTRTKRRKTSFFNYVTIKPSTRVRRRVAMSKYRTRRTSKRGVNMFTTSLAAHAAYAAPAEPRTRRQRQHPLSSTRPHARRSTLVVAAPAAASAAPIHALESRRALAESRASRRRTTVAHGLPIPIIGGLFNGPIMTIIYVFVAARLRRDKAQQLHAPMHTFHGPHIRGCLVTKVVDGRTLKVKLNPSGGQVRSATPRSYASRLAGNSFP